MPSYMTAPKSDDSWDFSPVFNLISSLSKQDSTQHNEASKLKNDTRPVTDADSQGGVKVGLGDFNQLWDYLGVQRDIPPPAVAPFERSTAGQALDLDSYASDGALYYPPSAKSVKWRDEEEGLNLTDIQHSPPSHDEMTLTSSERKTKTQRKKANRKARKAAEKAGQLKNEHMAALKDDKNSADEFEDPPARPVVKAIPQKAVEPTEAKAPVSMPENTPSPVTKPTVPPATTLSVQDAVKAVQAAQRRLPPLSQSPTQTRQQHSAPVPAPAPAPAANISAKDFSKSPSKQYAPSKPSSPQVTTPKKAEINEPKTPNRPSLSSVHQSMPKQWPVAKPHEARQQSLLTQALSSNITPSIPAIVATPPASQTSKVAQPLQTPSFSTPTPHRRRNEIIPVQQNADDRNWSLLLKLISNFPDDKKHLLSPLQLTINKPHPQGIHVFVDASNILIGFMDTLKRARGIPQWQRVPRVDLNFHALALLMERRRPVARRILAGSTPEISAFEEARQVGYETNILDKVFKAKELTERQRRFALLDQERRSGSGSGNRSGSDSAGNGAVPISSTPGSTAALTPAEAMAIAFGTSPSTASSSLPAPNPKWVEQAVDEILHLKILESVVDTEIPSSAWSDPSLPNTAPTMVLATGDAAEAEYSQGFMKMVQRALQKGWNVEVAAWGKSVSQEYRRMERAKVLGGRFRIVELDDYAEELFGERI